MILHRNLTLIETDDPALLVELMADPALRNLIAGTLSPTTALVLPQGVEKAVERMRKLGHTPKVSQETLCSH